MAMLTCADKSLFERPPELYGKFGEAARRATRQDQYPETGRFGEFTGAPHVSTMWRMWSYDRHPCSSRSYPRSLARECRSRHVGL